VHAIGPFHSKVFDSRGDAAIMQVLNPSGWNARAWVFVTAGPDTGRNEAYTITGDSTSPVGTRVCATGATSAMSDCGTVRAVGVCVTYSNAGNVTVCGLGRASFAVRPGDSGAPVYSSHLARGLVSGATGDGQALYQGIRGAENLLNVDVSFDGG
jgi:streptogrisin C